MYCFRDYVIVMIITHRTGLCRWTITHNTDVSGPDTERLTNLTYSKILEI